MNKNNLLYDLIYKFNTVILNMIKHINEYYDDSKMNSIELILSDVINDTPKEPISIFLMYVYKNDTYRINILKGNDSFFINEEYDDLSEDTKKVITVFKFKHLWNKLDDSSKEYIKKSMIALVKISQKYILSL